MTTNSPIEIVSRPADGTVVVSAYAGESIEDVARAAVALAQAEHAVVLFEFNGMNIRVEETMIAGLVVASYKNEVTRRAEAYRASPEGQAAEVAREQREAAEALALQTLLAELPAHIGTESRLVDWIGRLALLDRGGFDMPAVAGENPAPSKSQIARWIVGQVIDAFRRNHAVHPVFALHAAKYTAANV